MSRLTLALSALTLILVTGALFPACTKKSEGPGKEREVTLAIWSNYISAEAQEKFTKSTGIKVRISNFTSNEELLAKVQAGASGIDVSVPSDYMVDVMVKNGLLQPLDFSKIPNRAGLDPAFLKQEFDPENKFSLPYAWTTAGIAINREIYKGKIESWKDLFAATDLDGKISLLDDVREVSAAALKMHGFSVNSTVPAQLDKAKQTLKELRKRVKMFRSDTTDMLVNKEVAVAHAYSSDAITASIRTGGKIEYVIPKEGGTRTIDNVVILKSAKNVEEAHLLINFLLSAEANASFVRQANGGPVVLATKSLLPPELRSNSTLFPPAGVLKKLERIRDLGETNQTYERIWTEVKSD